MYEHELLAKRFPSIKTFGIMDVEKVNPHTEAKVRATLPKHPTVDDILNGMLSRLGKAYNAYTTEEDRTREALNQAHIESARLRNRSRAPFGDRIVAYIMAHPGATDKAVATALSAGLTTVKRARKRLRSEGKI